jgi:hypothetical protein
MALSDFEPDPLAPAVEDIERRIQELSDERRRIWQSSTPSTGAGEEGRRQLVEIEQELEMLYQMKRELLARRAHGSRPLRPVPGRKGKPAPPAGLFRDDDTLVE